MRVPPCCRGRRAHLCDVGAYAIVVRLDLPLQRSPLSHSCVFGCGGGIRFGHPLGCVRLQLIHTRLDLCAGLGPSGGGIVFGLLGVDRQIRQLLREGFHADSPIQ